MKAVFTLALVVFLVLYGIAEGTLSRPPQDAIVRLRWATDANPSRKLQTGLFAKLYPGLEAQVDPGLGGDQTKLVVQCATGTGPDIIDVYSQSAMHSLVEAGVLMDLTPYAREMGFDPARTYPALTEALQRDGKQYRFPCNVWANCVVYNRHIFDDHGVPYPRPDWTYTDFIEVGKRLRNTPSRSGEKHIPVANWNSIWLFDDMLIGHGGRRFSPDGLTSRMDSPEAMAAMRLYYDLMFTHKVIPTAAETTTMSGQGGWGSGGLNWFSTGKAAMIFIGRWYIVQVPNYPAVKGSLGAALLPRVGNLPSAGVCDTRAAGVNVKSPHWREALKFLQYLASPEYGRLIVHDGDALPPNPTLARNGQALVNDKVEDPAFHAPFVQAQQNARPLDNSPFMDNEQVDRWIQEAIGKVENQVVSPEQALKRLADEINQQIRTNLERRPDLQKKYAQCVGCPYTPDWWRKR